MAISRMQFIVFGQFMIILALLNACIGFTDFCRQPLGMETEQIQRRHITASSVCAKSYFREGFQARLNKKYSWCSNHMNQTNQWVRVDLRRRMSITGISTQGDPRYPPNFVTKFKLRYSVDGKHYIYRIGTRGVPEVFDGATSPNQTKHNFFRSRPFVARYVEFRPIERNPGGKDMCARFELYGCADVCSAGFGIEYGTALPSGMSLKYMDDLNVTGKAVDARLNSTSAACTRGAFQIDLGRTFKITGIATQGHEQGWIEEFYYGDSVASVSASARSRTLFNANNDANTTVVHWFPNNLNARYLVIKPHFYLNKPCMRIEIIGCVLAPSAPTPIAVLEEVNRVKVTWKEPFPLNGILHDYRIRYKREVDAEFQAIIAVDKSTTEKIFVGLLPNTSYEFQVSATTRSGSIQGAWSISTKVRNKEFPCSRSKPRNLQELVTVARSSSVKWERPFQSKCITLNYSVIFIGTKSYNKTFLHTMSSFVSGNVLQYKITGLYPATNYSVKIAANTDEGTRNIGPPITVETKYSAPPKPSADKTVIVGGNTEVRLKPVPDINGPISEYQLFLLNGRRQVTGHRCTGHPTGKVTKVPKVPLTLSIEPGVKSVKGVSLDIDTIGNFTLCYRAVISNKLSLYYGEFDSIFIERKTIEKVDAKRFASAATTTQFVIPLVRGPAGTKYYHIVVMEHSPLSNSLKDPSQYNFKDLGPFNEATHKPGTTYIAAEITPSSFCNKFSIGDGEEYSRSGRKRRNASPVKYKNAALKPNTEYSVFQRVFISETIFYSSKWIGPLKTKAATNPSKQSGKDGKNTGLVVGIIVPIIIIIILVAIAILFIRRRQATRSCRKDISSKNDNHEMQGFQKQDKKESVPLKAAGIYECEPES